MLTYRFSISSVRLLALATIGCLIPVSAEAEQSASFANLVVVLIDEADVPAMKNGVIAELPIREGDNVTAGQLLARLDDREAQMQRAAVETELAIAEEQLTNQHAVELSEKKLAQQQQLMRQHAIAMEMAEAKAENEVRILASEKAEAVAKNELGRAVQARERFADSVSRSEIDSLRLAHERAMLETKQASFERQLDALQARSERETANTFRLGIERSEIELAAVMALARIQQLEVNLGRQKHQLADLAVKQHQVLAPWDGVVAKRIRNQGEWVKIGEPVVRLIRLDRLRAEGYATAETIPLLRSSSQVKLTIEVGDGQTIHRTGEIVFISPELDPVNQERPFWVEFDNPQLDVLPGMRLSLKTTP